MLGYFNNEEATREAITPDGWLHTGDVGVLSEDGYLTITDRKKEILVMSNGKNVAPQPIEGALALSPFIAQSMVVGDGRNYVTALVVPNFENLVKEAKDRGWSETTPEALAAKPEVRALLRREIDLHTKDFARYEQIKEFAILCEEFSLETDELSPKLSLKRRNILKRRKDAIDTLYGKAAAPVQEVV
jgi:long-chain acyl-CoA synthetase